jgi:hypothetical protein
MGDLHDLNFGLRNCSDDAFLMCYRLQSDVPSQQILREGLESFPPFLSINFLHMMMIRLFKNICAKAKRRLQA